MRKIFHTLNEHTRLSPTQNGTRQLYSFIHNFARQEASLDGANEYRLEAYAMLL